MGPLVPKGGLGLLRNPAWLPGPRQPGRRGQRRPRRTGWAKSRSRRGGRYYETKTSNVPTMVASSPYYDLQSTNIVACYPIPTPPMCQNHDLCPSMNGIGAVSFNTFEVQAIVHENSRSPRTRGTLGSARESKAFWSHMIRSSFRRHEPRYAY